MKRYANPYLWLHYVTHEEHSYPALSGYPASGFFEHSTSSPAVKHTNAPLAAGDVLLAASVASNERQSLVGMMVYD